MEKHPKRKITREEAGCPDIWDFCVENFNKPILSNETVVRCIGYGETDMDCYVIVSSMDKGVYWHTGVGGYTSLSRLQGQSQVNATNGEIWDDLTRLDSQLGFNRAPKVNEFQAWFQDGERESWLNSPYCANPPS
jgi:hypothetical protein